MSRPRVLVDTGPIVALLSRNDAAHAWAREQFGAHPAPFFTCEAVLSEACFLLRRNGLDASAVPALLERGVLQVGIHLTDEAEAVRKLFQKYGNVPASLADACLIRLSELHERCLVLTLDSDFHVYRRHGRRLIPLARPTD